MRATLMNSFKLSNLLASLTHRPQTSVAASEGAASLPERDMDFTTGVQGVRVRRSLRHSATALFGGLGGFYVLSALCHVAAVTVIATVPIKIGSSTPKLPRQRVVDTEIKPKVAPSFDLVSAPVGDGPGFAKLPPQPPETQAPESDNARAGEDLNDADAEVAAAAAVLSAIEWLARHQESDGHWSLVSFENRCRGSRCGGAGNIQSDAAGTALALLPLLGAGDAVAKNSHYQQVVALGTQWLLVHQRPDGDLSAGGDQRMYAHAVAGTALCRHYALSHDARVGAAAQLAVHFTEAAQNKTTGGWHFEPGGSGNTSSVAWQLLFLRAADASGLKVEPHCWALAQQWLGSVAQGRSGGVFGYEPKRPATPAMTCVGLMWMQYKGLPATNPAVMEGRELLLSRPPDKAFARDVFYWYFGSHVVRHYGALEWKPWLRRMRRDLLATQVTSGCATGSWCLEVAGKDKGKPGVRAGRLLTTSLATQLLVLGSKPESPSAVKLMAEHLKEHERRR